MDKGKGEFNIEKQEGRDFYMAEKITIQQPSAKEKITFPLDPSLHNQTAPEVNFVGRKEMLETITGWYKNPDVRIGGLIGWGGVGKSAL